MTEPLRIFFYDSVHGDETPLRKAFEAIRGVMLIGVASSWQELRDCFRREAPDLVAFNLDGKNGVELDVVHRLAEVAPGCNILGISRQTDAQSIIAAMRAGCSQFVCWPVDPADLTAAVGRIRAARMAGSAHVSKRICVIGAAGGSGATTVACNLAMELAHITGVRCALVDLNLEFGDVAGAFDCSPRFTLSDACDAGDELDKMMMAKALHELPCNVSILARPESLEDAQRVTPESVLGMLRVLAEMMPFTVVDVPRSFGPLTGAALRDADHVLIVTQLGVPFIRNAGRLYEGLRELGIAEQSLEIVLNRCKSVYERITPTDVESHFGKPIFASIPNDYRRVQTALDFGHPIVADSPNTPARLAIAQMARKLIGGEQASAESNDQGGLLSRFWSRSRKEKPEGAPV